VPYAQLIGAITIFTLGTAAPASGAREESERLVPEAGILFEPGSPYHYQQAMLRLLLGGANTPNRKCQMVLEDGFVPGRNEVAVFFERQGPEQSPVVITRVALKSIAHAVSSSLQDPKRPEGANLELSIRNQDVRLGQSPLAEETGYLLEQICEVMLGSTRYPNRPTFYNDARTAHFAHHDLEHGYRAGKTTSRKGRVDKYVKLLLQLSDVALAKDAERPDLEAKVLQSALALKADLQAAGEQIPDVKSRRGSVELPRPAGARPATR
jgi:hypothetical protein